MTFPVAKNKDGSTIVGPATEEFVIDFNATPATDPLTYPAATADKSKAFLTVRENYGDNPQAVPSNGIAPGSALRSVRLSVHDAYPGYRQSRAAVNRPSLPSPCRKRGSRREV